MNGYIEKNLTAILVISTGFLFFAAVSPAIPGNFAAGRTADLSRTLFSDVCHQGVDRTPVLSGTPLAVCSRCLGIYTFLFLGFSTIPIFRRNLYQKFRYSRALILVAAGMLAIDVLLQWAGVYQGSNTTRFVTGAVLGTAASLFIMDDKVLNTNKKTDLWNHHNTRKTVTGTP